MRIAVAGKGGSGKTTTAATLARLFARHGYRVAAIDDDPNPNLSTAIGVTPEQRAALGRVPREEILEEVKDDQGTATLHLKRPFVEVLQQYGASGPDGVGVLAMTGLLGAGRGWLCGQHATVRGLIGELGSVQENDVTVLDMEASIEHLSRGTLRHVDVLLMITEPYYRSLETLGRMVPLARELGIKQMYVVANKVRGPREEEAIRHYCAERELEILALLPFDEDVLDADQSGTPILDRYPDSAYVKEVEQLQKKLSVEAGSRAHESIHT